MAWPGFFQFGGTEIINTARTEAYAQHLNVGWFKPVYRQPDLAWLLGDTDYATPLQDDAPWSDPDNLDSYDFLGVYPLEITGIEDSTTSAEVVESIIDGGYVGKARHNTRAVVFSAVLAGLSECAVEYGLRWLRAVLAGSPCFGKVYGVCGGADLCYLGCFPAIGTPDPPLVPGPPMIDGINLAFNPGAESGVTDGWNSADVAKYVLTAPTTSPISGLRSILATRQAATPVVVGTNRATNPNLEGGATTGWQSNDSSRYVATNSATSPISGSRSLVTTRQAASPGRTAGSILMNVSPGVRFPVTPGQQYTIGVDVKTENAPVVEATNLAFNPIGTAPVTTYWNPTRGTLAAAADYLRHTSTDATVAAQAQRITSPLTVGAAGSVVVTPGQVIRAVGQVRSSASNGMAATIQWMDAANAAISSTSGIVRTANPSTWTEIEVSGTAPANTVYAQVQFGIYSGARAVNDTFDVQKVYVGTAMAPMPWFDGNTAASGDYSYRWTGTAGGSTSERVRANPPVKTVTATNAATNPNLESGLTGWSTADATRYTASLDTTAPISGTQSALLTRTATSLDVNAAVFNINGMTPNAWIPISNGVPVTLGFDIKTELANRAIKVSLNQYDAAGAFLSQTPVVTLVAATSAGVVQRVVQTITPNNANAARGYLIITVTSNSGNATAGERVWVDNLRIGGDGAYFDGDTPASGGNFYRWTGARLTSTSERYTETPNLRRISLNAAFDVGGNSVATVIDGVQPGAVTRIVTTVTAPAGSSGMYPVCVVDASNAATVIGTGERVWFDSLLVEAGATSGAYYDGSTPAGGGFSYRWTGAVNASTSEKLDTVLHETVAASVYLTQSAAGLYAVTPGESITVGVDVKVEQASRRLTGQLVWLNESGVSIGTTTAVVTTPAAGVVSRLVLTGTPPTGAVLMRPTLMVDALSGASVVGERVWFDNLYVGPDASGAYFDGNTPDTADFNYQWTGSPNASTSVRVVPSYVEGTVPSAQECYDRVGRSLHEVTVTTGPTVTAKMEMTDGGCAWSVTWTMVAANPAEFGVERPLIVGFLDPAVEIPYYGGVVPPGGSFDPDGYVQTEVACPATVYNPVFDPTCSLLVPPPDVPTIVPTCFSFPVNYTRRSFTIPRDDIPLWTEVVPVVSLTTGTTEARNVRIRFYADTFNTGTPTQDPCNYCGDVVFSYIPPGSTIVLDGMDQAVYVDQPGLGRRRADSLVSDSTGNPFEWPQFSCGFGYVVTVDTPQTTKNLPIVDLSLVPRTL